MTQHSHFDDILERASGVPVNQQHRQAQQQEAQSPQSQQGSLPQGAEFSAGGISINLSRDDLVLVAQFGQLVLLFLIWREL